ncbi:MAG: peptidylprolyl isomerase [Erysipelotrichaceae bacterium]|nr:peptidylprolyl isomerase [Erysipelotrichaceae bacterium]
MDKKEFLKKYWFICLIAAALLVFIGIYAADSYKNREITVSNKQIDDKYVVYTVDGEPVYADDFYEKLYAAAGQTQAVVAYERAIFEAGIETTEEMKNNAAAYASTILQSYSQEYVLSSLKAMGYTNGLDDLTQYYIDAQKQDQMIRDYVTANADAYVVPALGTNGRIIYHILVQCETEPVYDEEGNIVEYKANPTEEQTAALNSILEYLSDENNTFEYAAYQFSEDTGSKDNGGYIGAINEENAAIYDEMFAKAALALNDDEVSDVVVSQFGYHIIKNVGSTVEKVLNDYYFLSDLENSYPNLAIKAILEKGAELGFEIKDKELLDSINSQLESEEN